MQAETPLPFEATLELAQTQVFSVRMHADCSLIQVNAALLANLYALET